MRLPILASVLAVSFATGCVFSHAGPGLLYMDVQGPLAMQAAPGQKTGRACARNLFGIVSFGDATIESAKRDGSISTIKEVSYSSSNVIGFGTFCTVVAGE